MNNKEDLLIEGRLGDAIVVAVIVRKMIKPIRKSAAYRLGIVNEKGKKIRKPETPEEKKNFTILDKFIFKLKYLLGHRVSNLATFLLLLSDEDVEQEYEMLIEKYDEERRNLE